MQTPFSYKTCLCHLYFDLFYLRMVFPRNIFHYKNFEWWFWYLNIFTNCIGEIIFPFMNSLYSLTNKSTFKKWRINGYFNNSFRFKFTVFQVNCFFFILVNELGSCTWSSATAIFFTSLHVKHMNCEQTVTLVSALCFHSCCGITI